MRPKHVFQAAFGLLVAGAGMAACSSNESFGFPSRRPAPRATATSLPPDPPPCAAVAGETCFATVSSPELCEQGDNANYACNKVFECSSLTRRWEDVSGGESCPLACPAAYTTEAPADLCGDPDARTLICAYPQGTCGCARVRAPRDGGADGSTDADVTEDAGEAGDASLPTTYEWRCVTPAAGCPRTRPRLGQACVKPLRCDYGACLFDDGVEVVCSRTWIVTPATSCDP